MVKGGSVEQVFDGGVVPPPVVALLPHAPRTTVNATPAIRSHFVIFIVATLLPLATIPIHQRRIWRRGVLPSIAIFHMDLRMA
jgi:hypothetical protein